MFSLVQSFHLLQVILTCVRVEMHKRVDSHACAPCASVCNAILCVFSVSKPTHTNVCTRVCISVYAIASVNVHIQNPTPHIMSLSALDMNMRSMPQTTAADRRLGHPGYLKRLPLCAPFRKRTGRSRHQMPLSFPHEGMSSIL